MISDSQTRYGSARWPGGARHGSLRRWRSYQANRAVGCGHDSGVRRLPRCRATGLAATVAAEVIAKRSGRGMTEHRIMNKPSRSFAKPLRDVVGKTIGEAFRKQGFASAELVTRWTEIVGADIAARSEPIKIQWQRPADGEAREPGTLVLRVEGPAAIEIQHSTKVICERVNQFLGWRAVARVALRQAPLRRATRKTAKTGDPAAVAQLAASLPDIADEDLRQALARLGTAVKRR